MKNCSKCGALKELNEFSKDKSKVDGKHSHCKECQKEYRKKNKEKIKEYNKEWYEHGGGREKAGCQSMYKNKACSNYLGIVIAERLVRHLFNDVEVMPNGNPKFDFICNRGKKIDVKSCTARVRHNNNSTVNDWAFHIDKNTVADYFICVAFDNVDDINPIHMWMIPVSEINMLYGIQISSSVINKWNKWERSIEDVQMCCNTIRRNDL